MSEHTTAPLPAPFGPGVAELGTPAASVEKATAKELGQTGLRGGRAWGGWIEEEFIPALRGTEGAKVYRQMADNDPIIGAVLLAVEKLIGGVEWRFDPKDDSDAAREAAEWAEDTFFKAMTGTPWHDVVEEALSMLVYGFAPHEIVYNRKEDGSIGVAKLAIRSQETIWRWEFNEAGEVTHLEQWRWDGFNVMIPMAKVINFRMKARLDNPEGRSLLRNAYISWVRKNTVEEAEGRLALRSAGLVLGRIPGRYLEVDADDQDKAVGTAFKNAVQQIGRDRQASVVIPSDLGADAKPMFNIEYLNIQAGEGSKLSEIVNRLDNRIAGSFLADFILLGQDSTGSYALSSDKTTFFARIVGSILDKIRDPINRTLLPKLWKLNNFPPETMPELKAGDLEERDVAVLAELISKLAAAGMPLFPSKNGLLEKTIMELARLPHVEVDVAAAQELAAGSQPPVDEDGVAQERDHADREQDRADRELDIKEAEVKVRAKQQVKKLLTAWRERLNGTA